MPESFQQQKNNVDHRRRLFTIPEQLDAFITKKEGTETSLRHNPERLINFYLRMLFNNKEAWEKFKLSDNYDGIHSELGSLIEQLLEEYNDADTQELELRVLKHAIYTIIFHGYTKVNGIGTEEESSYNFTKRNANNQALFAQYDPMAFSNAIVFYEQDNPPLYKVSEELRGAATKAFQEIYSHALQERLENLSEGIPQTPVEPKSGYWYGVNDADTQEYNRYVQILKAHSSQTTAGWCTGRGHETVYTQKGNTMHILHGKTKSGVDFDGEHTSAYSAIRTIKDSNGNEQVVEVRGNLKGQNMSRGTVDLTIQRLREMKEEGVADTQKYILELQGLKPWHDLENTLGELQSDGSYAPKEGEELEKSIKSLLGSLLQDSPTKEQQEQLKYLLGNALKGVGYGIDTSVRDSALSVITKEFNNPSPSWQKIIQKLLKASWTLNGANGEVWKKKDIVLMPPRESDIERPPITKDTKIILGNYTHQEGDDLSAVEVITGNANFWKAQDINLSALTKIGGDAYFGEAQNINLSALTEIGGYADFEWARNINLSALTKIGGDTNFEDARNIIASEYLKTSDKTAHFASAWKK